MKRLMLASVVALFFIGERANATCIYQGARYSEGSRICMHRTMFMCRGEQWVKTAERCWERYSTQASPLRRVEQKLLGVPGPGNSNVTACDALWRPEKTGKPEYHAD